MEVKPGYKRTEVGVIPEEWEVKRLGDLASVTAGGTPSRTNPQYWNGDIPWVTTSEVDFYTINHAEQFITKEGLTKSAAKLLPRGTLLMALYGQGKTRGKVGILGIEAATNQACAAISLNHSVFPEFIFHFLSSQYEAIRKLSNTGNQENLNGSLVRSISVLLPPPPEQRAIATALSDVNRLLGGLDRLIAKKRDLKQAAMQQLLTGQTRLPDFHGEWVGTPRYRQTEAGVVPEDWRVTQLGALAEMSSGTTPARALHERYYRNGSIAWVKTMDLTNADIPDTSERLTDLALKETGLRVYPIRTVLVAMYGGFQQIGRTGLLRIPAAVNQAITAIQPSREKLVSEYLLETLNHRVTYWKTVASSSRKDPNISSQDIRKFPIAFPKPSEQRAIAEALSYMDAELAALEKRREKTRALKQAMMQELLTGRTRLISPEEAHA